MKHSVWLSSLFWVTVDHSGSFLTTRLLCCFIKPGTVNIFLNTGNTNIIFILFLCGFENWLKAFLLSYIYFVYEATEETHTSVNIYFSLTYQIPLNQWFCFCFLVCMLCFQTPSHSWQMVDHAEPGSAGGFYLLKGSFLSCFCYMQTHYEEMLQSQQHNPKDCSLLLQACPGVI